MDMEARARGLELAVAVAVIGGGVALGWPLWTAGIAFSLGAVLGLLWITRATRELGVDPVIGPGYSVIGEGLPFMMLAVLGQLLANADRFLLAILAVPRTEIGYWGVAATIVWAVAAIPQLLAVAVYPTVSRLARRGRTWRRAGFISAASGVAIGVTFAVILREVAGPVVHLFFGPEFEPAVELMRRLAMMLPGSFTMTMVGTVYASWQRQNAAMWILAAAFCISFTLNLLWIPFLGPIACANAAVAAYSVAALVMTVALVVPVAPRVVDRD
jgi:O-antigen/teichoic acid export membrane protein